MRKLLLLVLPAVLLGCPATPEPKPPPPPPAPGGESCETAEKRLLDLECKDRRGRLIGGPNMHDKPWRDICHENINNGVDMKTECITRAVDCVGVSQCRS